MEDYLKKLFIDEAKPALKRHSGGGGVTINNQDKTITENGTYTADEGYTGLGTVTVDVQSGGGGEASVLDSVIDNSVTEITSNATSVGCYKFYQCQTLTTADFPLVTSISIGAFTGCSALTTINFPLVRDVGDNIFNGCTALTTADFPLLTSISNGAFSNCKALTTINFPLLTSIGSSAFSYCTALTTADFPLVTSIDIGAFSNCSALTTADFPLVTSISNTVFRGCIALTTADFPLVTSISSSAFPNCSKLTALILRSETMATLSGANGFSNTSIASGRGYIYVPRALVDTYKSATNWSTYANQFRVLEDYTVDGTINGELDESKI